MSSPSMHPLRLAPSARRVLWGLGLLLTVAGLFAMHGLASHGLASHGTGTTGAMQHPTAHSTSQQGSMDATAPSVALSVGLESVVATAVLSPLPPSMDMSVMGMCLTVLALALLLLLSRLRSAWVRSVLWQVARPPRIKVRRGRHHDPPSLYDLSIQRC